MGRLGNEISYQNQNGVPVRNGDVIGFHTPPSPDPILVVYYPDVKTQFEVVGDREVHYIEGVRSPYCELSLCNSSMKAVPGALPFVQTHCKYNGLVQWYHNCFSGHGSYICSSE